MENKKDSVVICPGAQVLGDVELGEVYQFGTELLLEEMWILLK